MSQHIAQHCSKDANLAEISSESYKIVFEVSGNMRVYEFESLDSKQCTARKRFPEILYEYEDDFENCVEFWYNSPIPGKILLDNEEGVIDLAATPKHINYRKII